MLATIWPAQNTPALQANENGKTATLHVQHAFCTLLCRHCRTTTWNCLISRFVEDVNTRQLLSFSFSWTRSSLQEFNSTKKIPAFDDLYEMEKARKSLKQRDFTFKQRFRSRRSRCCLEAYKGELSRSCKTIPPRSPNLLNRICSNCSSTWAQNLNSLN